MLYDKFRVFLTTVQEMNMTRAAEKLKYSQSGVSHLISSLEEELGFPLFIRSKAGVQLTPEGEKILPYINKMLACDDDMRAVAQEIRGLAIGSLAIGTFSSVAICWLPELLNQFRLRYPNIEIRLINGTYSLVEQALLENRVDCAFVSYPSRREFQTDYLAKDRLLVVVQEDCPLAEKESLSLEEIQNYPFILPAEGSNYNIGSLFSAAGIRPDFSFDVGDDYAALVMVRQKLGITILPELLLTGMQMEQIKAIPLKDTEREIGIAINKSRYPSPAAKAFLAHVKDALQ